MDEITHQISRHRSNLKEGRGYDATFYGDGTSYDGINSQTLRTAYYGNATPSTAKTGDLFRGSQISSTNGQSYGNIYFGNNGTADGRKNNRQNSYNGNSRQTTLTNNGVKHRNQLFDTANYGYSHVPSSSGVVATVGTEYNQTLINNANYYGNQNGAIYDVNCANEQCNVLRTSVYPHANGTPSANSAGQYGTAHQQYYDNTAWESSAHVHRYSHETVSHGHGRSSCSTAPSENTTAYRQHEGSEQTTNGHSDTISYHKQSTYSQVRKEHGHSISTTKHTPVGVCHQTSSEVSMSDQKPLPPTRADDSVKQENGITPKSKVINDVTSRKRKMCDVTTPKAEINNNDITSPKIDKRALYSKFRVVKKSVQSPTCNESSKVKPFLWRVKLGDKSIVDVNDEDGLPNYAKMSKIVPTLTPLKENEADATIGNIEFITLDNMKVVRRKLEVVLAVQQEEDVRQERLRLEAEVKAKVKANVKSRSRKDKKRKERKHRV